MLFAPRKEPFFDTKSKCGPNSRPKVPLARINTGEQALFRLPENSAKSPLTQVQNRGFWVREKHASDHAILRPISTPPTTTTKTCARPSCRGGGPAKQLRREYDSLPKLCPTPLQNTEKDYTRLHARQMLSACKCNHSVG